MGPLRGCALGAFVGALFAAVFATLFVTLFVMTASSSAAQEVRVDVDPGPHYQGQPVALDIVASGFEEEPAPEIEFDPPDGMSLRFLGVSPSTSTSITIVNGKMTRVHEVTFVYRYELSSRRVGAVGVPEFRVRQGQLLRRTRPFPLEIASVPTSDEFGISVVLPQGPIFVGQKVPVAIELRIDNAVLQDYLSYTVEIPLFDVPGLRFVDTSPPRSNTQLEVTTAAGLMRLPAVSEERMIGGRSSLVLRAERTLIAQKPGMIRAEAPAVAIERGTRFRRDLFGQRRAVQSQRSLSTGRSLTLEVAEVPAAGRPASFAGAVGSGFSLEVTADRSVVQLGEPIALTFHLRGHGDLSSAGLPPLAAEGLFDPARFRLPDEAPAGLLDDDGKHFEVTLRVLDAGVREIPALAYSWFDAESRRFETIYSQPIALSVGAAQVVGADAVASRAGSGGGNAAGAGELGASPASGSAEATGGSRTGDPASPGTPSLGGARSSSLAESAANLAVERDPDVLLRAASTRRGASLATIALYGIGLAFLGLGFVEHRRRAVDPRLRERLLRLEEAKAAIEAAVALDHADGPGALGRALRQLVAAAPDEATPALDALLAECDALRFAPGSRSASASESAGSAQRSGKGVPAPLAERARRWIDERRAAVAEAR